MTDPKTLCYDVAFARSVITSSLPSLQNRIGSGRLVFVFRLILQDLYTHGSVYFCPQRNGWCHILNIFIDSFSLPTRFCLCKFWTHFSVSFPTPSFAANFLLLGSGALGVSVRVVANLFCLSTQDDPCHAPHFAVSVCLLHVVQSIIPAVKKVT